MSRDHGDSRTDVILGARTFGMWEDVRIKQLSFGVSQVGLESQWLSDLGLLLLQHNLLDLCLSFFVREMGESVPTIGGMRRMKRHTSA